METYTKIKYTPLKYRTDLKSELILEELHNQMAEIQKNQRKILRLLEPEEEIIDEPTEEVAEDEK